jgi:TPR repeat protein
MVLLLGAVAGIFAPPAQADLYQAVAAAEKKDFARAFELYRELAELGHPGAQENLAVMYVTGEGVKLDHVLGFAWAKLALEQGAGGEAARTIVAQLEPHLNAAARSRIAEVHAQFGSEGLTARLLPTAAPKIEDPDKSRCKMRSAPDPDKHYPPDARRQGISGEVLIEARVAADGSVRLPRAWYSFPLQVFEEAGRIVALKSTYTPAKENGAFVPCTIRFKVKFSIKNSGPTATQLRAINEVRARAEQGDPNSQLLYGLVSSLRPEFKPKDNSTNWTLKAAQAGVPAAQHLVGLELMASNDRERNEAKGIRWLEMAVKGGSGGAMAALASHLLRADQHPDSRNRGFVLMERSAGTTHREGKFLFASLLVSWPESTRRDPARALALLKEVGDAFDYDPLLFEIRAAALAAQGDFQEAKRAQRRAVTTAESLGWDTESYRTRLQAYEQGRQLEQELIRF